MICKFGQNLIIFEQKSPKSDAESHVVHYKPDSIEKAAGSIMSVGSTEMMETKRHQLGISA